MSEETASVKDPCPEGTHRIVKDENDFKICEDCGLDTQSILGWVGHELTEEEYCLDD